MGWYYPPYRAVVKTEWDYSSLELSCREQKAFIYGYGYFTSWVSEAIPREKPHLLQWGTAPGWSEPGEEVASGDFVSKQGACCHPRPLSAPGPPSFNIWEADWVFSNEENSWSIQRCEWISPIHSKEKGKGETGKLGFFWDEWKWKC